MGKRLLSLAEQLDDATLRRVFTHTSWASERVDSYERLEFLGDSVLSLAVTTELYRRFPAFSEGHLARLRAYVVSRATCAKVAAKLGLGRTLRERANGIAEGEAAQLMTNTNVLADLTEALIGALYVTFGYEAVRPAVVEAFSEHIDFAVQSYVDHKTELQEYAARLGYGVGYRLVATIGPPHHREFEIEVVIDGEALGRGVGSSKKRAEQDAAAEALAELQDRERRGKRRARLRSRRPEGKAGADGGLDGGIDGGVDGAEPVAAETTPRRRPSAARPAARVADDAPSPLADADSPKPRAETKAPKPPRETKAPKPRSTGGAPKPRASAADAAPVADAGQGATRRPSGRRTKDH
ncbi:MAG TPA: ribonuclease III [Thermoleophilia bacterium]|nr:ribonuclease III [Thermoleophilia bacterium]